MEKHLSFVQDHIIRVLATITATMTIIDLIGVFWQCVSGTITVILFCFGAMSYYRKKEIMRIEKAKLEQELYDVIESNKKKHGTN